MNLQCSFALGLIAAIITGPVFAEGGRVVIAGGADQSGHQYSWTVTNQHDGPIVRIAFPHFRADLFFAPEGWSTDKSTYIANVGVPDQPGVCVAEVGSHSAGIKEGGSETFRMQISARGAQRGRGPVTVTFADGTQTRVAGVELPQRPQVSERFITLIALTAAIAVWLGVRAMRGKKVRGQRCEN